VNQSGLNGLSDLKFYTNELMWSGPVVKKSTEWYSSPTEMHFVKEVQFLFRLNVLS
jgi:hypothetical protein